MVGEEEEEEKEEEVVVVVEGRGEEEEGIKEGFRCFEFVESTILDKKEEEEEEEEEDEEEEEEEEEELRVGEAKKEAVGSSKEKEGRKAV